MSEKKFVKKLRTFGMSMKVPLAAIIIGAALIPLFLEAGIMLGTFRQSQLDARFIEIQNQCVILSNKMTRSGYMTAEKKNNASLDSQMQTLSDVYNGRIVIVGSNFRVVTDTFNLATGKYYLSEEVIKCFKGENSSHYNKDMQYFAQTIPVYDAADGKAVSGVIVVTASTENIPSLSGVHGACDQCVGRGGSPSAAASFQKTSDVIRQGDAGRFGRGHHRGDLQGDQTFVPVRSKVPGQA